MVECGVCRKEYRVLNQFHLMTHNLTPKEYDEIYPENPRYSKDFRKKMGVKNNVNHSLFDEFNYQNVWLIGLLTADGSHGGEHHPYLIQLYNTEKGLLEEFKRLTNCEKNLTERAGLKGQLGNKIVYQLAVNSMDIVDRLKDINAYGNKRNRNPFQNIPDRYKWSFIRGLFDGDGNFYKGALSIAGRKTIITEVQEWICKELEREPVSIYNSSKTNETFYFQFHKRDTKRIVQKMLTNSPEVYESKKIKKVKELINQEDNP